MRPRWSFDATSKSEGESSWQKGSKEEKVKEKQKEEDPFSALFLFLPLVCGGAELGYRAINPGLTGRSLSVYIP